MVMLGIYTMGNGGGKGGPRFPDTNEIKKTNAKYYSQAAHAIRFDQ